MSRARAYWRLLKPGITISNTIAAAAGTLLGIAVSGNWDGAAAAGLIIGIASVIGSACVVNNVIDEKIDAKMSRTKKREVVTGSIARRAALMYAAVLGLIGFGLLYVLTNRLTLLLGVVAYLSYVVIYGAAKRRTIWSTVIGTLPGALPPVAGYTAITGHLDATTFVLFMMMALWQLGHFYAIAMFRRDDYRAAGIPVWSVARGMASTKRQLYVGVWLFLLVAPLLSLLRVTGLVYAAIMVLVGIWWVVTGWRNYRLDDIKWARKMFGVSLVVLLVMCGAIAIGGFAP